MPTKLAIHGAAGRMGQRLVALSWKDPELELVGAIDAAGNPDIGKDAGQLAGIGEIGVPLTDELIGDPDVVIDFSIPQATMALVRKCMEREIALVTATTGLDEEQRKHVDEAAHVIPLLWAPNMSLAVNLLMKLSGIAAEAVQDNPQGVDVEILERHHRFKEDSPSGTALRFGEIIAEKMGHTEHRHGRHGIVGQRPHHEIGYHAIRTGDNPGEHTIIFGFLGETIELTVRATSRDCYALGALAAARFLAGKEAGMYSINDVLGL